MYIAFACSTNLASHDAGAIHIYELIKELENLGHQVTVFGDAQGAPGDIKIVPLLTGRLKRLRTFSLGILSFSTLWHRWRRERPDVVYIRFHKLLLSPLIVSRLLHIPCIVELNTAVRLESLAFGTSAYLRVMAQWSERLFCRCCAHIVAVSEGIAQEVRASYGVNGERISVVPNGVNLGVYAPQEQKTARIALGLERDVPLVAYVGSFQPWQDVPNLIAAMPMVLDAMPRAKLLLVGDGPDRSSIEAVIERLGLQNFVFRPGWVPEDQAVLYMVASDVCVLNTTLPPGHKREMLRIPRGTHFFGSPVKLRSYMATGRPVVATHFAETGVLVEQVGAGIAVPSEDPESLARAIIYLLTHPDEARAMGEAGRRAAEANYGWHTVAKRIAEICEQVRRT